VRVGKQGSSRFIPYGKFQRKKISYGLRIMEALGFSEGENYTLLVFFPSGSLANHNGR